ncbi:MAG: 50S ribosomal protein L17 [bacterium]
MRHRKHKYRLASDSSHRKALMRSLACALIEHERIVTTVTKAKALRGYVEKLITAAKRGGDSNLAAIRKVASVLDDKKAVKKIFSELAPRFEDRPGGYTRVLKIGHRKGDAAEMAMIQFVDYQDKRKAADKTDKKTKETKKEIEAKAEESKPEPEIAQADSEEKEAETAEKAEEVKKPETAELENGGSTDTGPEA